MKKLVLVIITLFCVSQIIAEGARYLIIAPDSFVQALQPLADWKIKKGVKAIIVPLSITGNTAVQIKNYILNAYNTWQIRPEYVLLAGSGTVLPYFGNSDDYFANMDSNYRIELSIGRFPCATSNQCQNIVFKTLSHERTPFIDDTTWYLKGTTVVREDQAPYDAIFWDGARYSAMLMHDADFLQIDSMSRLRGQTHLHIEQAINDGRSYIIYFGDSNNWWWIPFNLDSLQLNNSCKFPIMVSVSCVTVGNGYPMIGEYFMRTGSLINPKGAVGYFGTTRIGSAWDLRVYVGKSFFRSIFFDDIYKLGDVAKRAKYMLDSIYNNQIYYQEWNLYGDPELNLWTAVPKPLTVTYDSIIHSTPTNVTVTVMSNGMPVPNALICLMKDTTIYQYGYSDSNGIKVFSISPQDTGTISITVTARNCHPFEGIIRVLPAGIEEITLPFGSAMTKRVKIFPNPCSKITEIYCNQVSDIAIYDVQGRKLQNLRVMSSDKSQKFILNLENLKAGVYMVVVKSGQDKVVAKLVRY